MARTPAEALAACPEGEPRHYRTYPRVGSVYTIDQVKCGERAKELIYAMLQEVAVGEIEGDWLSGAIDNIDFALEHISERIAQQEAAYEEGRCTCRPRAVRPTDIDPPEVRRDRNCPIHGIDPDRAREDAMEDER